MKIAVCYSGLYRHFEGWKQNHERITRYADKVLYTTWKSASLSEDFVLFSEPKVDYNPFQCEDFVKLFPDQARFHRNHPKRHHLTKQIIGHQLAVDYLQSSYDVVIKMRYDITLGDHDWYHYVERVYKEKIVIGFGGWTKELDVNKSNLNRFIEPGEDNCGGKTKNALCDFMIIHPTYKMKDAINFHNQKKLFPANKGWYQVLVDPYNEPHINLAGGVMLTRHMRKK